MNAPVNVLAVIERAIDQAGKVRRKPTDDHSDITELSAARAAVAELIEATTSAKNAIAIIAAAEESDTSDKMLQLMFDDLPRLRAAIANVGGAA